MAVLGDVERPIHRNGSSRTGLFYGYLLGGAIMIGGGLIELAIGIKAEGKSLEEVTKPLTSTDSAPAPGAEPIPSPA